MSNVMTFRRSSAAARALEPPAASSTPAVLGEQLSRLYERVQGSPHVFASPAGPFDAHGPHHLPRFVYFGPEATDAALRLSFLAGLDHRDLRSTLALLRFVEGLAARPDLGQGLNLSFFPLLDVLGLAGATPGRDLSRAHWARSTAPEIALLEKDARGRAYHGFVRVESAVGEDVVTIRLSAAEPLENLAPALELISSEDLAPLDVRWESAASAEFLSGPLSIADDLPIRPFELLVRIPANWPLELYAEATASILRRFVLRYCGFFSYAQHL